MSKKILVTGAAGFVGFHVAEELLKRGNIVVGLDNVNDYYDPSLKFARLEQSGIDNRANQWNTIIKSSRHEHYSFIRLSLEDKENMVALCVSEKFDVIVHLAAQAGVRNSIENPDTYIQSNILGFFNILELCRHFNIKHLIYASSSSVYGSNSKIPFSTDDKVDTPISLYAATKKSNELMAHTYSHLYGFKTTGLRFFTVYGPWGRPDMAMFLFTDAILKGNPINVFNSGNLSRDFTYIDDIVDGIIPIVDDDDATIKYRLFNIGNNKPVRLLDFIEQIEKAVGKHAIKNMMPMQPGDVAQTWADVNELKSNYGYNPSYSIEQGVLNFVEWYKAYFQNK